jgi:hypothetical protein
MHELTRWRQTVRRALLLSLTLAASSACSETSPATTVGITPSAGSGAGGASVALGGSTSSSGGLSIDVGGANGASSCEGLRCQQTTCKAGPCQQAACAAGVTTTVSGVVYDPAGKVPLYNAVVYVPSAAVPTLTPGAICDRCDTSVVSPIVSALTDTHGKFVLGDVPVGADIPLVIQVGKWRRQVKIPSVAACVETPLTDPNLTRLPRNQSEGDIPLIAIATGGADSMECLPRRMGLDDSEFSANTGSGRIHLFSGADHVDGQANDIASKAFAPTLNAGAAFPPATELWNSVEALKKYDIVILSCEGGEMEDTKPMTSRQALYDYASLGGRVFASHWHRFWFSDGPNPVPQVGTWQDRNEPDDPSLGAIDMSFPKGAALADWLVNVNASTTLGQMEIIQPRDNVQAVDPMLARSWISVQNSNYPAAPSAVQYLSFNAPLSVPEAMTCGRAVFTDLHVSATGDDTPGAPFPMGCEARELSSQEKAVSFMLFDLSACIQDDADPPRPPK